MTNAQLLRFLRKYIDAAWRAEERIIRHGSAYYPRKAEYDGVIMALNMLTKNLDKAEQPEQSELS